VQYVSKRSPIFEPEQFACQRQIPGELMFLSSFTSAIVNISAQATIQQMEQPAYSNHQEINFGTVRVEGAILECARDPWIGVEEAGHLFVRAVF
jgi:hypothetical protein